MIKVPHFKIPYLFSKTLFRTFTGADIIIGSNVRISQSKIVVSSGAKLMIASNVSIKNVEIYIEKGSFCIGDYSILQGDSRGRRCVVIVNDGNVNIGHHSKLSPDRIWVRFGGNLTIGNYTNINRGSEIRCDEKIEIGSYNQISYSVKIWDTNTHRILDKEERRKVAEKYYPYFGYEECRPVTSVITIGDDCWLGEETAVLKGSNIGSGSVIGFRTTIVGQTIPTNSRVVQEIRLRVSDHQ